MSASDILTRFKTNLRKAAVCSRLAASCFSINRTRVAWACIPRSEFAATIMFADKFVMCCMYCKSQVCSALGVSKSTHLIALVSPASLR